MNAGRPESPVCCAETPPPAENPPVLRSTRLTLMFSRGSFAVLSGSSTGWIVTSSKIPIAMMASMSAFACFTFRTWPSFVAISRSTTCGLVLPTASCPSESLNFTVTLPTRASATLTWAIPPFSSMSSCSWAKYPRSRYHWSRPVHTRLNSREENVRPMRCWDSSSIVFAGSTLAPVTTTPCRGSFSSSTSRKAIPSRVSSANGVTALKYPVEKTRSTSDCTSESVYAKFGRRASMPSASSRSSGVPPSTATAVSYTHLTLPTKRIV